MVAESDSVNIFEIGLLVFEILHNRNFSNAISSLMLIKLYWRLMKQITKHPLNTKLKRFFKSDKPFKSYDQISIYM